MPRRNGDTYEQIRAEAEARTALRKATQQKERKLQQEFEESQMTVEEFKQEYGVDPGVPERSIIFSAKQKDDKVTFKYIPPATEPHKPRYWHQQVAETLARRGIMGHKFTWAQLLEMGAIEEIPPYVHPDDLAPYGAGISVAEPFLGMSISRMMKVGEATVGHIEQAVTGEPSIRAEIMGLPELALEWGLVGVRAAVTYGPKMVKAIHEAPFWKQHIKFSRLAKGYHQTRLAIKSKLPIWRGTRLDVFLAKHSARYYRKTGGLTRGEIEFRGITTGQAIGFGYGKEFTLALPETYGEYMARETVWKALQTPRMGGVTIYKLLGPTPEKTLTLPHLISRKGFYSIGYLGETSFKKGEIQLTTRARANLLRADRQFSELTPFVSQSLVTRMGIHPHIPSAPIRLAPKPFLAPFLGLPIRPMIGERIKPREKAVDLPMTKQQTRAFQELKTFQRQKQYQRQKQKQRQIQKLVYPPEVPTILQPPTLQPPTRTIPIPRRKRKELLKLRKPRGLAALWYPRKHPLATPKQVRSLVFGSSRGRKKDPFKQFIGKGSFNKKLKRLIG